MRRKVFDISIPVNDQIACWPGDARYQLTWTCRKSAATPVNVGQVSMSAHTGSHIDAPFHFDESGSTVEALAIDPFIGPARVIDVRNEPLITRELLASVDLSMSPRLLLKTNAWTDYSRFPDRIPAIALDVPELLHARGVVLLGVDVPSVDAIDSKDLPNHHALGSHGIAILESLRLVDVLPGVYELIALPLKLVGADAAPVRAILRSLKDALFQFQK